MQAAPPASRPGILWAGHRARTAPARAHASTLPAELSVLDARRLDRNSIEGGHYATLHTHIDEFVQAVRMVAPAGVIETRRLPGSGAGPDPEQARQRFGGRARSGDRGLDAPAGPPPSFRASASARFGGFEAAVNCVRALSQSGLNPTNCRCSTTPRWPGPGSATAEVRCWCWASSRQTSELRAWMQRALELVRDFGGEYDAAAVERSMQAAVSDADSEHRKGAAGAWRDAFIRMPYWRDPMVGSGAILDTFETAITWDRFDAFYRRCPRGREMRDPACDRTTGKRCPAGSRTSIRTDPAPYFTYSAPGQCGRRPEPRRWLRGAKSSLRRTNPSRAAAAPLRITTRWAATTAAVTSAKCRRSSARRWSQPSRGSTRGAS